MMDLWQYLGLYGIGLAAGLLIGWWVQR